MKKYLSLAIVILIIVSFSGCGKKVEKEVDNRVAVETTKIVRGDLGEYYSVSGVATATAQASITAKTPGKITTVLHNIGDSVSVGQVLCSLDKSDFTQALAGIDAQIGQATAGVDSAQVGVERARGSGYDQAMSQAEATVTQAEEGLNQAKNRLTQAEITYNLEQSDFNNIKILYESGNISKMNFDSAQAKLNSVKSSYDAAQSAVNDAMRSLQTANKTANSLKSSANDSIKTADTGVSSASAGKKVLEAQRNSTLEKINDMDIKAPINGVIIDKKANIGEMATGQSALFVVADISKINFEITVPEGMINKIVVGQEVKIIVNSIEKQFIGSVKTVAAGISDGKNGYSVLVEVLNTNNELKPGMYGAVNFLISSKQQVIYAPVNSIITEEDKSFVFLLNGTKVTKKEIKLGIKDTDRVEILEGLNENDAIISKGQKSLFNDVEVRIVKEN